MTIGKTHPTLFFHLLLVERGTLNWNPFQWNERDQEYQGILSSNYRHSINMFTAFLKNCEILNEARQKKTVWISLTASALFGNILIKIATKTLCREHFSCLKVRCSLYGFHRVVHWSPSCSIVDLWYLCKRASITYQPSKAKELESELILRAYGITQYVMRCVPKWLLSGLKRYTCPEIRPENE